MSLVFSLGGMIFKSFYGRMVGVALLAWGALLANNAYQRSKGRVQERTAIVEKTNEKATERNAKARKIRKRNSGGDAVKRLRQQYGPGSG